MIKATVSIIFLLTFMTLASSVFSQTNDLADLMAKSESLMTQGDFYEALITLQPLLTTDQKSHSQEKALWTANQLCETLIRDNTILFEYEKEHTNKPPSDEDYMQYEKIVTLNKLGADIGFNHLGSIYDYNYGFLKQLVDRYPDSKLRPSSEYYLIQKGYNEPENVEKWLKDLYSYVNKYSDSGIGELYMAYYDIAHINDDLWWLLTYPDGVYSEPFKSSDSTVDKEKASKYKAEALKYFAKVIVSGYAPRFGYFNRSDIIKRFQELRRDEKKKDSVWIIYD